MNTEHAPDTGEQLDTATEPEGETPDYKAQAAQWKALARKNEARAKENAEAAKRLAELEDANKSEVQRAIETAADAERRAQEAELRALRLEVATERGLSRAQMKFVSGATREDIDASITELMDAFTAPEAPAPMPSKPTERLRGGIDPTGPEPIDAKALVDSIPPTA